MSSGPSRTIEIDKALILGALGLLIALGWITGAPILEPFGRGRLTYVTVLALPVLVVFLWLRRASGGVRSIIDSWWPVVGILAVYESLKHMHANRITQWLGIEPKDALMLRIDEALFGKALPLWLDSWTAVWFQELMTFCYIWIYYLWPVVLLAVAYLTQRLDLFRRLRLGLVFGLLGGYVLYIFVPVAGPLYLIGDRFQHTIPAQSKLETLFFDQLRFQWDCFPSLHTAIPWILTVLIWRWLPRWVVLLSAVLASSVTLSTVALRIHYGIDLIAAFVWVAIVCFAVERCARSGYGRFRVRLGKSRRRPAASASAARSALRISGLTTGLFVGASLVALLVQERWSELWLASPLQAGAGCIAGAALGFAIASGILGRLHSRRRDLSRLGALAGLGIAAWIALLGSPLMNLSIARWSMLSITAVDAAGLPAAAALALATSTILPGLLVGLALGAARHRLLAFGLPDARGIVVRSASAGAAVTVLIFRAEVFPRFGYGDSLLCAALLAAVGAFLAQRHLPGLAAPTIPTTAPASVASPSGLLSGLGAGALGGLIPLWTFLYPAAIGESYLAFASVMAAVAMAVWLAGPLARRAGRRRPTAHAAALLLIATGVALAATCRLWDQAPQLLARTASLVQSPVAVARSREVAAAVLIFLPAWLLAATLRLLGEVADAEVQRRRSGNVWLGIGLGSALLALAVFPFIGAQKSLASIAALASAGGLIVLLRRPGRPPARLAALLALSALGLALPAWVTLPFAAGVHLDIGRRLHSQASTGEIVEESVAGFVGRFEERSAPGAEPSGRSAVVGNGHVLVQDEDRTAAPALGLALHFAARPHRALLLGAGPELAAISSSAGIEQIDVVEPSAAALSLAYPLSAGRDSVPDASLHRTSARRWLSQTGQPYDLVVSLVGDTWRGFSRGELTREFYALVRDRLDRRGVFVQVIRLEGLGVRDVSAIVAAFSEEFETVQLWLVGRDLFVAALPVRTPGSDAAPEPAPRTSARDELDRALQGLGSPWLSAAAVSAWMEGEAPAASTDRDGRLELNTPNYRLLGGLGERTPTALRESLARRLRAAPSR